MDIRKYLERIIDTRNLSDQQLKVLFTQLKGKGTGV
jgi:hypothetical protein